MQRFNIFVAVLTAALAVEATTWKVSLTEADKQGLMGVDALTNALTTTAKNTVIELAKGIYDISPVTNAPLYQAAGGGSGGRQVLRGVRGDSREALSELRRERP